jgi:hypothetical protein
MTNEELKMIKDAEDTRNQARIVAELTMMKMAQDINAKFIDSDQNKVETKQPTIILTAEEEQKQVE